MCWPFFFFYTVGINEPECRHSIFHVFRLPSIGCSSVGEARYYFGPFAGQSPLILHRKNNLLAWSAGHLSS